MLEEFIDRILYADGMKDEWFAFLDDTEIAVDDNIQFTVRYNLASTINGAVITSVGFEIRNDENRRLVIPLPDDASSEGAVSGIPQDTILRAYKVFGFTAANTNPRLTQLSSTTPVFLYTPYIDIYSDNLTNYQRLKDTDSSTSRRKGLIARMYLSGVGNPQTSYGKTKDQVYSVALDNSNGETLTGNFATAITDSDSLGSAPFFLTYDLNSPKVIKWTVDSAVNSLDFQMRDCYGDLVWTNSPAFIVPGYSGETFNTEFQMTLLCVEKDY
jgi:hypothetical protein